MPTPSDDALDAVLRDIEQLIAEHGWSVQGVGADEITGAATFSYTAGLTAFEHPELIIFGINPLVSQGILNNLGVAIRDGARFESGDIIRGALGGDLPLALVEAADVSDLTVTRRLYGDVSVLQVVWCDPKGRFPWERRYSMSPAAQPSLGPAPTVQRELTLN